PAAGISLDALPIPAPRETLPVRIDTLVKPLKGLAPAGTAQNSVLELAARVAPLAPITSLAFSPDGTALAAGSYRSVMIWNTRTGKPQACLQGLAGPALCLAFSPDGGRLAVAGGLAGNPGEVRVFDTKTWHLTGPTLKGHSDSINSVAWNPGGTQIATASQDHSAKLWSWPAGTQLQEFKGNGDAVTRIVFAPDGKTVFTASADHSVRRYDITTGQVKVNYTGHGDVVSALAISPDGRHLVSSGTEPQLWWWNPDSGNNEGKIDGNGGPVNDVEYSKDGKLLASASADKTVRIWNAGNAQQERALEGSQDWEYCAAISPDDKLTAGGGADGIVRIWETATGRQRLSLLFWPPFGKEASSLWLEVTPEGYYVGASRWTARLQAEIAGRPIGSAAVTAFLKTLDQPSSIVKAWTAAPLDAAVMQAAPTATSAPAAAGNTGSKPAGRAAVNTRAKR
ncbi:MAG TPA: WD40 repeat domain-containing protein, partial [Chthonomonadales bacterium]|nr:WD40 repeat domain-containing protein [Chthonomonadales bacterium]